MTILLNKLIINLLNLYKEGDFSMKGIYTDEQLLTLQSVPTVVVNQSFQILDWNKEAESQFGYKKDELINHELFELIQTNIDTFISTLKASSKITRMENIQIISKTGALLNCSLLAFPFQIEHDVAFQIYCLINEQVKTVHTSSTSLEDLKNGVHSSFMTVTLDDEGFIISTNTAFLKTSRWTPKRVIGKTFWNLFPTDDASSKLTQDIWKTITNGNVWQGETQKITKDGIPYWVLMTAIPLNFSSLKSREYLLIEHDITKDKQLQLKLEKIAYIDTETGLMNIHRLEQIINEMVLEKKHFSFVYLSLDNYYTLRDIHNGTIGDNIIIEFTKRLKMYFQDSSMARINENDFVVITPLPEWFIQGFLTYLQQNPIYNGNTALPVSLSGGITRYPEDQTSFAELMKASITTISQVREAGGGVITALSKATHKALNRKSLVEKRLLLALDQDDLNVLYQPQWDLHTGKISTVEALVRWNDDEIGVVSPDELIPIAEETGLIHNIGKFMLEKACEQALKWQEAGLDLKVSINSSVGEFRDKNMAKSILEILSKTSCPAHLIQIEITEKFALEAEAEVSIIQQMRTLEREGITFILDDFGTGYASFRYIQLLPIQVLKIDQTFTNSVMHSEKHQRLVHGMVQLGKSMNLTVIAEGVETKEQKDLLSSFGCDAVQGYYISKPIVANDIPYTVRNLVL